MVLCISCKNTVRPRQEALQCDGCSRWQHRTCHTGITQAQYRAAVQSDAPVDWWCTLCRYLRLVSDKKLKRLQRKRYRNLQAKLFDSWDKYDSRQKTIYQLLKTCARLNGPARDN